MTVRAAIYARVSSAAQREANTVESQLHVLRPFVASRSWNLVETYVDDGRSAKTGQLEKREAFARCIAGAEAHHFDVLVVFDVDRLTRTDSIEERAQILGPFQRAGIRIVTPSSEIDLGTMFGQLDATMRSLYAAEENRKRAERIKAGKARAIAEGRKPAGPTPYGLAYSRAKGTWSVNEEAATIVREICRRVICGEACQSISNSLNDRGVRPPRGPWTREKVWKIARSRHIVGEWTADKRTRAVLNVPAIVDEMTWHRVQEKLLEHGKRGLVKTKHVYLLEGLGVCGLCGSPIAMRSPTRNWKRVNGNPGPAAYICRARKYDQRGARCTAPILPVADVDARVWAIVARALVSQPLAEAIARRVDARNANARDWQADVVQYERRLKQMEHASAAIAARFRRGTLSETAFDIELAASGRERAMVTQQLERARQAAVAHDEPVVSADEWLASLRSLSTIDTPEARQRIVRKLIPKGGALFVEHDVELTLDIDDPATATPASSSRLAAGSRSSHGAINEVVRLRLLAR